MLGGAYYTDCDAIKKMSEHTTNKKLVCVRLFLHLPNDVKAFRTDVLLFGLPLPVFLFSLNISTKLFFLKTGKLWSLYHKLQIGTKYFLKFCFQILLFFFFGVNMFNF
jgi:hypothetical protein